MYGLIGKMLAVPGQREVWDSSEDHAASLKLPAVQAAIAVARPLIAGFGERFETEPVGGVGLSPATE